MGKKTAKTSHEGAAKKSAKTAQGTQAAAQADELWKGSLKTGTGAAKAVLARREKRLEAKGVTAMVKRGTLVAEGDSWFDYPLSDVVEELEDRHGWDVRSVAHFGDTVEEMAYSHNQLAGVERVLRKLSERHQTPKAVLLSGGGNDIAGSEFAMLLNHAASGLDPLNESILHGVIDVRLRAAVASFCAGISELCRQLFGAKLPIVLHGYDYPVPDGRGFLGGAWILPGPWLEPGFRRKGYDDLAQCTGLMKTLIDRFNALQSSIAGGAGLENVHYVDLRGTLSNELAKRAYKKWWGNELHPTEKGFEAVARKIHELVRGF